MNGKSFKQVPRRFMTNPFSSFSPSTHTFGYKVRKFFSEILHSAVPFRLGSASRSVPIPVLVSVPVPFLSPSLPVAVVQG